jgi:hypothetical protein
MFFSFFIWFAVHTQPFFFIKFSFLMWLQIRAFRNPKIVSISPFFHLINFVNIRTVIFWNKAGNLIMTDLMKSGYLFSVGHCQNLNFDMPEIIPVFTVYGRPLSPAPNIRSSLYAARHQQRHPLAMLWIRASTFSPSTSWLYPPLQDGKTTSPIAVGSWSDPVADLLVILCVERTLRAVRWFRRWPLCVQRPLQDPRYRLGRNLREKPPSKYFFLHMQICYNLHPVRYVV